MTQHGTYACYVHRRCRCADCREACARYNREYRRPRQIHGSMHGARPSEQTRRSVFVVHTWFGEYRL